MTRGGKQRPGGARPRTFVLDSEALSQAVRGDERMMALLGLAAEGEAEVVTSPMTVIEAEDGRTRAPRWDWVLSRVQVASLGREEARQARKLLADAGLHGHKHAIDAVLAVVARQQKSQVTVFTSDVDDMQKLLPTTVLIRKV